VGGGSIPPRVTRYCGRAGARPGLISLAAGFDPRAPQLHSRFAGGDNGLVVELVVTPVSEAGAVRREGSTPSRATD
jgi:hypothetical protein